jgi:hypothetical protein
MDSAFGTDVLGLDSLPPSPLYPVGQLPSSTAAAPPSAGPDPGSRPRLSVPLAPPASTPPASAIDLAQQLGTSAPSPVTPGPGGFDLGPLIRSAFTPQGGVFGANTGQFMSALGGGLSSAGQNWNKPAMAAFASGAGAALQGGQQWQAQQQEAKLKALNAAIAAWKTGDMTSYHQALAQYHAAVAQQRLANLTGPRPDTRVAPPAGLAAANAAASAPAPQSAGQDSTPGQGAGGGSFAPPAIVYGSAPAAGAAAPAVRQTAATPADPLAQARDAVARGAPRDAVIERLRVNGIDPAGL